MWLVSRRPGHQPSLQNLGRAFDGRGRRWLSVSKHAVVYAGNADAYGDAAAIFGGGVVFFLCNVKKKSGGDADSHV